MYSDECRAKCSLEWWHSSEERTGEPWLHQQVSTEKVWNCPGDEPTEIAVMYAIRAFCDHDPEKIALFFSHVLRHLAVVGWIQGYEEAIYTFYDNCRAAHEAHEAIV